MNVGGNVDVYTALPNGQDLRRLTDDPHFDACAEFCERWDSISFDPDYDTMPLDDFVPLVHRMLAREPNALWRESNA